MFLLASLCFRGVDVRVEPARLRRFGVGLVALVAALTTASCTQGQHAQTAKESPAIDGTNASIGSIDLRDVAIVAPSTGPSYPVGSSAELTMVIVNNGSADDNLVGVTSTSAASVVLYGNGSDASSALTESPAAPSASSSPSTSASSSASSSASGSSAAPSGVGVSTSPSGPSSLSFPLAIPAGERVTLGLTGTDKAFVIAGLMTSLYPATQIPITFTFQNAGTITIVVPVQLTSGGASRLVVPSLSGGA
jgi:copper(I)-binding protein